MRGQCRLQRPSAAPGRVLQETRRRLFSLRRGGNKGPGKTQGRRLRIRPAGLKVGRNALPDPGLKRRGAHNIHGNAAQRGDRVPEGEHQDKRANVSSLE